MTLQHQQTSGSSVLFLIFCVRVHAYTGFCKVLFCVTQWLKLEARQGMFQTSVPEFTLCSTFCLFKIFWLFRQWVSVCTFSSQGQCTWIGQHPVGPWSLGGNMPFSLPVHLSVSRRGGEGGLCHLSLRRDWQKICVDCVWFQPSPHPG